jgi:acetylornithine/N-succinyldiaminopimelate aminotransferase
MSNSTVTLEHPTEKTSMKLEELKAAEAKLLLGTYDRYPMLFERGDGVHLIDENGVR